jgi:hypothetical protein
MDKAMLRVEVARFAGEVDRLQEEAARLRDSGWNSWVPAHRGEMYGAVAEALHRKIVRATRLEGETGDIRNHSRSGPVGPPPDADGHNVLAGRYAGFGSEDMEVQVLILERASKEGTLAMLRKMADWLERDWASLTDTERHEAEHGRAEEFGPPRKKLSLADPTYPSREP